MSRMNICNARSENHTISRMQEHCGCENLHATISWKQHSDERHTDGGKTVLGNLSGRPAEHSFLARQSFRGPRSSAAETQFPTPNTKCQDKSSTSTTKTLRCKISLLT